MTCLRRPDPSFTRLSSLQSFRHLLEGLLQFLKILATFIVLRPGPGGMFGKR